jgi:hypothetical protein
MTSLLPTLGLFLLGSIPRDLLDTSILGQNVGRIASNMSGCTYRAKNTLFCSINIENQPADVSFLFSDVAIDNGQKTVIAYEINFANFTRRDRAIILLKKVLMAVQRSSLQHEEVRDGNKTQWTFYDPRWAVTRIEFVSGWGVENSIVLTSKSVVFLPAAGSRY